MGSADFRKLSERQVYRSSLLEVAAATFEAPDGTRFDRDIVHHPGAVVVVPLDEGSGEVVFVRQYRAPLGRELLEVPAGKRDVAGEANEVTAARELAEETGLEATRLDPLGSFFSSPGFCDEQLWCFLARGLNQGQESRHGPEEVHMSIERHPLSEVDALVRSGQVMDGKTIVSLFLAKMALS